MLRNGRLRVVKPNQPHPDDFMTISIGLEFRAKVNPAAEDPPTLDAPLSSEICLPAEEETAVILEEIATAIRERRLYGYLAQCHAENPVACKEWIGKTDAEIIAEHRNKQP